MSQVSEVCKLITGTGKGAPKLVAGTYLIARNSDWSNCSLKTSEDGATAVLLHNGKPATFDCLILTVSKA
jgi:hypothetical protein